MKTQLKKILSNNILKSSAGILLITGLVKILGYAEKLILANYFGTSYQVDVYTVVITLILSIFYFFREIVEPGYLNVFIHLKRTNNGKESWNLFNAFFRLILIITIILSIIALLSPGIFSMVFAPGFSGEKLQLTNTLIRIAIPASIFLALSTLTSITLNGLKIFVLPASGELAFKAGIIICMVVFYKEYGIIGAAIGITIGSIGRLGVHLIKLYKKISFKKVTIESKYKKHIWQLTWPLLIGVGFSQVSSLIDNVFASYLQEGAIAALTYAKKVVELPVILFPYVISIVIFPYFTQLSVEKEKKKLKTLLGDSLKWILIAFVPISVFFIAFSTPIIQIIFQRGAFDAQSTLLTAKPFLIYAIGLIFFAIETIVVIFYYSNADTKTPVFIGMACVLLNIFLTWVFIHYIGYVGIALAFVIQKSVKNILLLYLLKRKVEYSLKKALTIIYKTLISTFVLIMIVLFSKLVLHDYLDGNTIQKIASLILIFSISGGIYLGALWILKVIRPNIGEPNPNK